MGEAASAETGSTPFVRIGGTEVIARIVDRFYDLMDSDPAYAPLRAMHGEDLAEMRASLRDFLVAWLGGPRDWFARRPGACIMSMHRALPVTAETGRQWLEAMMRALDDAAIDPEVDRIVRDAFARMTVQMGGA